MKIIFSLLLSFTFYFNLQAQINNRSSIQLKRDLAFYSDSTYLNSHVTLQKNGTFLGFRHKEAFVRQWESLPENLRIEIYKLNDYLLNRNYDVHKEIKDFLSAVALIGTEQDIAHLQNFLAITSKNRLKLSRQQFSNLFRTIVTTLEKQHLFEFYKDYIEIENKTLELHYNLLPEAYQHFSTYLDSVLFIPINGKVHFQALNDLLVLEDFEGIYLPDRQVFIVQKARADWRTHFLDQRQVFVQLKNFILKADNYTIKTDDALLTYQKDAFDFQKIKGRFTYLKRQKTIMPLFQSYQDDYSLPIAPNLELIGGFTLLGKTIEAAALNSKKTTFKIKRDNETKFEFVTQNGISIKNSILKADLGKVAYHITPTNTIEHPAMSLYYDINRNKLVNRKDKYNYRNHPTTNNLQSILIGTEQISWMTDTDSLCFDILNAREDIPLTVESDRYFSIHNYKRLQGLMSFNPLKIATYYSRKIRKKSFEAKRLAHFYKLKPKVVRQAMQYLQFMGFLTYDPITDLITLKKRAYFYTNSSLISNKFKKTKFKNDYDQIRTTSRVTQGHNAVYTFNDSIFKVSGIKNFTISDSLDIIVQPTGDLIELRPNHNIRFDGSIQTGQTIYYGKKFGLDYDSFSIVMQEIDSMSFLLLDTAGSIQFN